MTIRRLPPSLRFFRLSCLGLLLFAVLPAASPEFLRAQSQPSLQKQLLQQKEDKPYALIVGTVWGPDNRPVFGVRVTIRRATDKPRKVRWEVYSDHHGEFAQRVPPGEADYILSADLKGVKLPDGTQLHCQDVTVHIYGEERQETGLHLTR